MKRLQANFALGVCAALLLALTGCGGGEAESIHTPAAQGSTGAMSTNTGRQSTVASSTKSQAAEPTSASITTANQKTTRQTSRTTSSSASSQTIQGTPISPKATPIVYIDSMMAGADLSFDVEANIDLRGSGQPWTSHIAVIRTYSELKTLYEEDQNPNKTSQGNNYIEAYDESFFQDNALIVLFFGRSSCSQQHKIDTLVKENGRLCVGMSTRVENGTYWLTAAGDFRTLIRVNQVDIRDVTDVVVYNADWEYES